MEEDMTVPTDLPRTLYFGYGSNLWLDQMKRRCPESKLVGIGLLRDWKWIINRRGYANIIPSVGDIVYGLMFELSENDEEFLDRSEGVPICYVTEILPIEFTSVTSPNDLNFVVGSTVVLRDALVYVDFKRVENGDPKEEYIPKINKGIIDGEKIGIPKEYFKKYFRPSIPVMPEALKEPDMVLDPFAPQL
ncbi:hypothetical protein DFP72DRAFT_485086 [Ephemerocybe angulata]|uniref:gamma-glutamylcyclotransferase n=1 Tax=Ephemerocybe angulata TaxID=980116 RepID=A0A8H6MGK4_9AGAR|nr:hypothetical protein DFP72DRAFT_485086 [Tulosesus angulatus]